LHAPYSNLLCFDLPGPSATDISTLSLHDALPIFEYASVVVAFEEGTYSQDAIATALKLASHKKGDVRVIVTLTVPQHLALDAPLDRKSTRLNSSHEWSSYAVFCLKKKK